MKIGRLVLACVASAVGFGGVAHGAVLFDFENAPHGSPLPLSVTVEGITANLSATGQGFSIQSSNALGFTPAGFSGNCIYPSSIYAADLIVDFPNDLLTDFSILYAPEEYATDSSALMRVTAYKDGVNVGTSTMRAEPGTWPSATLSISVPGGFNRAVVHYDSAPPTGGDYGPIFMADNMQVTVAVPEAGTLALLGVGVMGLGRRRRG